MSTKLLQDKWLAGLPWEKVNEQHEQLCKAKQYPLEVHENQLESARQLWEKAAQSTMGLGEAVEVCRRCCELSPFVFNNMGTFTAIAKRMVEDWVQALPTVEAEITRNTIGHYVAGLVKRRELTNVLHHAEHYWRAAAVIRPMPSTPPPSATPVQPTPALPTGVQSEAGAS